MELTDLKIKPLTKEQIIISIDRLTRFKNPEIKYFRVFSDIITHNLLNPIYGKQELENLDYSYISELSSKIINYSLEKLGINIENDFIINKKLFNYEKSIFKLDTNTEKLIKNEINYKASLDLFDQNCVKNLQWLSFLAKDCDIIQARQKHNFKYPIELVMIVEGATEETLLPEFAKLCEFDFDKNGIYVLSAGGKNQVVKFYYELAESLNLPIFVLLDKDGMQNCIEIGAKLRPTDKIHLLECGEFEDLLSLDLIKRTLSYELRNISTVEENLLNYNEPRVKFLEEIFKNRGMHEFKKASFAHSVKINIKDSNDVTPEIAAIFEEIKFLLKNPRNC